MKISISDQVLKRYPEASLGVVIIKGADNSGSNQEIQNLIKEAEAQVSKQFENLTIPDHPSLKAWRRVYKDMGAESRRCSAEAMVRRILKGDHVSSINKLVDLYNYISLKYVLPVGGEDLDKVSGDVSLTEADGTERFVPLFGTENEPPKSGEIIYVDESKEVLCRRWNWREADKTKLTEETINAMLVVEGIIEDDKEKVKEGTKELAFLVEKYCGGEVETYFLDSHKNEIIF
ncbi:TPA: hypothetical protein DDW69_03495 [candidate division CPR2 bacterium]|uniref:Lysine-tRNA ligase n=1 Tax=candidate division CPR2 bacterium GW2011_GWC1_41_48 TaxID=1618344 RepID=A0A0G0WAE2_UNCC2|nr:MAG: Lysine-tRNA ligase [candidate division CPR2 bacterium GW2011_GWC2_39_35]KKR27778.1 MAG: Lysine-tRNA ligase [candidate division CPR2 bacterium GW2011_GWD1_39_7]KKR28795.1 MAG: Lysine-tRNA ligase [candidate division CPR2 bacterium GW2011_GWD2_39_7]KKS09047.1 MAG: Lysine-tRNA ligase [candidate division CPR2 bacterium GW2011_GWC1_41_48]OGB59796.1 MAG: hypothetical protein A2Y27_00020 [candidate division CPR2 bacterium GWD1_39_7]OGB73155.1 MAG: hypothetical protein A2Y26_03530 [candidate di